MDAYRRVWALQRRRRAAAEPLAVRALRVVGAVAVVAALIPLVRTSFLWFLDGPTEGWPDGVAGVTGRAALFVLVVVSLGVHATVLRGPSRAVLQVHPVDPRRVVRQELATVARSRAGVVVAVLAVLLPIAVEVGIAAWALAAVVIVGTALAGLFVAALVFLGAVEAAESEAWAPWLDLLRGNNPRPQAAIIWALAPSTLVAGWIALQAAEGVGGVLAGRPAMAAFLAGPWVLALAAAPFVPRYADRSWFRASVVLADIRARYAAIETTSDVGGVALDWTVRWLPAEAGRWALLDLRYGWRERRSWLSATWLVAIDAFVVGWSQDPAAGARAGVVGGSAAWLVGALPVLQAGEEPAFLRVWLPRGEVARAVARAWIVLAWGCGPVLAGATAALLVRGASAAGAALASGVPLVLVAATAAAGWATLRARGMAPYVGTAALAIAGSGALWLGGTG